MKKGESRCLVVDARELAKQSYMMNPKASILNLQGNYVNEKENVHEIFERYDMPREFQKVFIKINSFISSVEYQEYAMGFPFNLTIVKDEHDKAKKYIEGRNRNDIYNNLIIGNDISFKIDMKIVGENAVADFFKRLNEQGYLPLYLQIIMDLFWDIPIEEMLQEWNKHQNEDRQVKIRRMTK